MNGKLILFSAIVTAGVGAVMGLGLAEMRSDSYFDRASSHSLHQRYAIVGTGIGFLFGAGLESVRELKKQQDREEKRREEKLRNYLHTYLSLRDIDKKHDE
jgi:hypothetical protein